MFFDVGHPRRDDRVIVYCPGARHGTVPLSVATWKQITSRRNRTRMKERERGGGGRSKSEKPHETMIRRSQE